MYTLLLSCELFSRSPIDLADTNKPVVKTVDLHFTAALSLLNYDEYTLAAGGSDRGSSIAFTLPGTWQSQWPGFSVPVLKIMLSTLLHNACIVDGGHVCINVLEHYMVSIGWLPYASSSALTPRSSNIVLFVGVSNKFETR